MILVFLAAGAEAGVKSLLHLIHALDHNIRGQEAVQPPLQSNQVYGAFRVEVGHLAKGMAPAIGPARTEEVYLFLGDLGDPLPYHPLDGLKPGLDLPAVVGGSIVLDGQLDVPHEASLLIHPSWRRIAPSGHTSW